MDDNKLNELLRLLHMQRQALTELAVELMTPSAVSRVKAAMSAQKITVFRDKIERRVRALAEQEA